MDILSFNAVVNDVVRKSHSLQRKGNTVMEKVSNATENDK